MATFNMDYTIDIKWWSDEVSDSEIQHGRYHEHLIESGFAKAVEMIKEGFVEGELSDNIRAFISDPEDGVNFSGYWKLKKNIDE